MELIAKNISFKYPSAKDYLLKDINLELDNNKIIGLIGDSGSGKSTLCKILSGYVREFEGEVLFEGKPLAKKGFKPVQLIYQHPEKVMNPKWKMKQVLEEYGIDTHVTVSMKGSIAGDMSQYDKSEVSGRMLKMLGAKTVTTGQIQDSYVVYAYAKSVKDSVSIGKNKINVNITMNYDETRGVTDIQLSTPIYNEDF